MERQTREGLSERQRVNEIERETNTQPKVPPLFFDTCVKYVS